MSRRHWLLVCAGSLVGWTLLVLILATQAYVASAYRGRVVTWWQVLPYPAVYYAIWALLTPPIVALATRVPPAAVAGPGASRDRAGRLRGWIRFGGVHLLAGLVVSFIQARLFVAILPRVQPGIWSDASTNERLLNVLVANVHSNLLIYAILVGATLGLDLYRRYRARELRASQLEARLARAELQMLKLQLQPHFLFNTLHAIQALVHEDPEAADRTIARLADLLRMTLESHGTQEVSLRRELAFLDCYLQIEQTRLGDRLRLTRQVDEGALDGRVPVLILQPLVENAIKHGVASRPEGGAVAIRVRREAADLVIEVSDDGPGANVDVGDRERIRAGGEEASLVREGVGLANTRARLEQLYGRVDGTIERLQIGSGARASRAPASGSATGELAIVTAGRVGANGGADGSDGAGNGFTVTLTIPWRVHADARSADEVVRADGARPALESADRAEMTAAGRPARPAPARHVPEAR